MARRYWQLVLLTGLASWLIVPPPTGAASTPPSPPLRISRFEIFGLPTPEPYVLLDHDGVRQHLTVTVVTTNPSKTATVGPSITEVGFEQGTTTESIKVPVPALKPGKSATDEVTTLSSLRPHLGFVRYFATANATGKVPDRQLWETPVPVLAYHWIAQTWTVTASLPGYGGAPPVVLHKTESAGLYFQFADYSSTTEEFLYSAHGEIKDIGSEPGCGTGSKIAKHDPWTSGGLSISKNLTHYDAFLPSSREKTWTLICTSYSGSVPGQVFQNMETIQGIGQTPRIVDPTKPELSGHGSKATGFVAPAAIVWEFKADVP
jgi:hypothetical protein